MLNHGGLNQPPSLRREPEKVYQFNGETEKEDVTAVFAMPPAASVQAEGVAVVLAHGALIGRQDS